MSPICVGFDFQEGVDSSLYNASTPDPTTLLNGIETWKNNLADERGYAHNSSDAYRLYPAFYPIAMVFTHGRSSFAAPKGSAFPDVDLMDGLRERGIRPVFWVQTNGIDHVGDQFGNPTDGGPVYADYRNWINGQFDDELDDLREAIYDWSKNANSVGYDRRGNPKSSEVILRINQEFNGSSADEPKGWFNYGLGYYQNDTYFIPFWRYFYNRIRGSGVPGGGHKATTASFFFCTWNDAKTGALNKTFAQTYPGDGYVDYPGVDVYSYSSPSPKMSAALRTSVENIAQITSKPIFIGEIATSNPDSNVRDFIQSNDSNPGASNGGIEWIKDNMLQVRGIMWYTLAPDLRGTPHPLSITAFAKIADLTSTPLASRVHARGAEGSMGMGGTGKGRATVGNDVDGFMAMSGTSSFIPKPTGGAAGAMVLGGTSVPHFTYSLAGSMTLTGTGSGGTSGANTGSLADIYLWEGDDFDSIEAVWENSSP